MQGFISLDSTRAHLHGPRVPKKYSSYETSGLTAEVTPGDNDLSIAIEATK